MNFKVRIFKNYDNKAYNFLLDMTVVPKIPACGCHVIKPLCMIAFENVFLSSDRSHDARPKG